jgi:YVTN family beta-propeller protein
MSSHYFTNKRKIFLMLPLILLLSAGAAFAQGTAFTFQGKLGNAGSPVSALDMQFKLFDAADPNPNNSHQIGRTITLNDPLVQVTNGVFTVQLDFCADSDPGCVNSLSGADRFLEIGLRRNDTDPYTVLAPRSKITSSPYAIRSLNATDADKLSSACVGCIQSSHINSVDASKLTGTIPSSAIAASSLPAGSTNYIQNTTSTTPQSGDFNINGSGTARGTLSGNIVNATTQYNILSPALGRSVRVLAVSGLAETNTFLGRDAGALNPTGNFNSFFGNGAGRSNQAGGNNSFFGSGAGNSNQAGLDNSFFGRNAGFSSTGDNNTFIGSFAGSSNTNGNNNTIIGRGANVNSSNPSNATAIGALALVTQNNSLVLGSVNGVNGATADTNVGIGTTAPSQRLHVVGDSLITGNLTVNGALNATLPDGSVTAAMLTPGFTVSATTRLALLGSLRWDLLGRGTNFPVIGGQFPIAFDGAYIWISVSSAIGEVTKLRASDGVVQGTFDVGDTPSGIAFDGANVWIANAGNNNVTKLRASDGACVGTCYFAVGQRPLSVAFDGANIWVVNAGSNSVTKLRASDGVVQGTFNVQANPHGIVFDGANIWVTNQGSNNVTKLRASDGACVGTCTFTVGPLPRGIAFDGTSIWVANWGSNTVTKLLASNGTNLATITVGTRPFGIVFDGASVWVTNVDSNSVTKLRASDGVVQGTFNVQANPHGIVFDGAYIWVVNFNSASVTRLLPGFP